MTRFLSIALIAAPLSACFHDFGPDECFSDADCATGTCVQNECTGSTPTNLAVVERTPSPNSVGSDTDSPVDVRFNLPMKAASATSFVVMSQAGRTRGTYSVEDSDIVRFTPMTPFFAGESVSVVLRTSLESTDGLFLEHPLVYSFTVEAGGSGGQLVEGTPHDVGASGNNLVVADFDGDARLDVALAAADSVVVTRGLGDGTFEVNSTTYDNVSATSIRAGDFDGNTTVDLAVWPGPNGAGLLLFNNGDGTFTQGAAQGFRISDAVDFTFADIDGDADLDAIGLTNLSKLRISKNNGDGTFGSDLTYDSDRDELGEAVGLTMLDVEGDGDLDIAIVNQKCCRSDATLTVVRNSGDGQFSHLLAGEQHPVGDTASSIAAGDIDGDGAADLVVKKIVDKNIGVLFGDGAGGFAAEQNEAAGTDFGTVSLIDLNGDDRLDIILKSAAGLGILRYAGGRTFEALANIPVTNSIGPFSFGDMDNDEDVDTVAATGTSLIILSNQ